MYLYNIAQIIGISLRIKLFLLNNFQKGLKGVVITNVFE